jgi:hypothetical protein
MFYVLRPQFGGENGDEYIFIGECYVHGFMDGEAMEFLKDGSAVLEQI